MSAFLRNLIRSQLKSCSGKVKYPSEDSARRAADDMMIKKGNNEVFEYYACEFCSPNWHIGHQTSFDWIPKDHRPYKLLVIKYECNCLYSFFTNTVISNRVINHFPSIIIAKEFLVVCHQCRLPIHPSQEKERKLIPLIDVPQNSTSTIEELWNSQPFVIGILNSSEECERLKRENHRLRMALLNVAGDNLCCLTDEEIQDMRIGKTQIPPWPEFGVSCHRFHDQVAEESGVLHGCMTIAQLERRIAELEIGLQDLKDFC